MVISMGSSFTCVWKRARALRSQVGLFGDQVTKVWWGSVTIFWGVTSRACQNLSDPFSSVRVKHKCHRLLGYCASYVEGQPGAVRCWSSSLHSEKRYKRYKRYKRHLKSPYPRWSEMIFTVLPHTHSTQGIPRHLSSSNKPPRWTMSSDPLDSAGFSWNGVCYHETNTNDCIWIYWRAFKRVKEGCEELRKVSKKSKFTSLWNALTSQKYSQVISGSWCFELFLYIYIFIFIYNNHI